MSDIQDFVPILKDTYHLYFSADTSDVQTARVVFFENNVFLTCSFASGSLATGCVFTFLVNQNGTGTEQFMVQQSMGSQQCNVTTNQRNGYLDISVLDLEADGLSLGAVVLSVNTELVNSEAEYTQMTGCTIPQGIFVYWSQIIRTC